MNPGDPERLSRLHIGGTVSVVGLLTAATAWTVHLRLTESWTSPEWWTAAALLLFNLGLVGPMLARKGAESLGGAVGVGLLILLAKLFVNTFTVFFLIGLQAVRPAVFIPVFFAGYFVLLGLTVWTLHRTTGE